MAVNRPCFAALRARNYEECVRFYRDAMGIPLRPGEDYVHQEYSWHDPYFHFAIFPKSAQQPWLALFVDDVGAAHRKAVAAGARVVHGPKKMPWGRTAEYIDPEGNRVGLVERP